MNTSSANQERYEIRPFARRINRELRRLPPEYKTRIDAAIESLTANPRPRNSVHLYANVYRIRVGNYRVVYQVDDENLEIDVGRVGRRDEAMYQNLRGLFRH